MSDRDGPPIRMPKRDEHPSLLFRSIQVLVLAAVVIAVVAKVMS